jgi:RNA polymerase sigma-70 factor, ECF subfamily
MSLFTPAVTLLDASDAAAGADSTLQAAFEVAETSLLVTARVALRPNLRLIPSDAESAEGAEGAEGAERADALAPDADAALEVDATLIDVEDETAGPESAVMRSVQKPTQEQIANRKLRAARRVEAEQDRVLIERARQGDQRAFALLVSRHQRRAEIVAHRLVRDREEARDLVQDAFLRVYKGLDSFHGRSSFFTWLYRILSNLAIDRSRRPAHRRLEYTDQADLGEGVEMPFRANLNGDPEAHVRCVELATVLESALDTLPSYHRDVIIMRELRGLSYEEMAVSMNVSKGTIMSRLFHARKKLHRELGRHEL